MKMMCYPDRTTCQRRRRELDEMHRLLCLKIEEIQKKISEVEKEKIALLALMEMQQEKSVIEA